MDYEALYLEAVERESWSRDYASASLRGSPLPVNLCGFSVHQLTLEHWTALRIAGSPFAHDGSPENPRVLSPAAICQLLWLVSFGYPDCEKTKREIYAYGESLQTPAPPLLHFKRAMRRWERDCLSAIAMYESALSDISDYFNAAFQDYPAGKSAAQKSFFSFSAGIVDTFGVEYGWEPRLTKAVPLAELFQLAKIIHARDSARGGKHPTFTNPSDKILAADARAEYEALLAQEQVKEEHGRN